MKRIAKTFILSVLFLSVFSCQKEGINTEIPQEIDNTDVLSIELPATEEIEKVGKGVSIVNNEIVFTPGGGLVLGNYFYTLQTDGNFVCYNNTTKLPVWGSGTDDAVLFVLQSDGNIVAYTNAERTAYSWNSETYGATSIGRGAVLQADGNMVVYITVNGTEFAIFSALTQMPQRFPENL